MHRGMEIHWIKPFMNGKNLREWQEKKVKQCSGRGKGVEGEPNRADMAVALSRIKKKGLARLPVLVPQTWQAF